MSFFFKMISGVLKSKRFYITLAILILSMVFSWTAFRDDSVPLFEHDYMLAFVHGCHGWTTLLAILAPLLSAIPFAAQHVENYKSGTMKYIVCRMGERRYFNIMFFANICLTAITFIIGMGLFFLICVVLFSKNMDTDAFYGIVRVSTYAQIADISPVLYGVTLIAHCAFVASAFSSIGLALSFFIKNKFVAWISPFIISELMALFAMFINIVQLEPMSIFDVNRASDTTVLLVICYVLIIMISAYFLAKTKFIRAMRKDEGI